MEFLLSLNEGQIYFLTVMTGLVALAVGKLFIVAVRVVFQQVIKASAKVWETGIKYLDSKVPSCCYSLIGFSRFLESVEKGRISYEQVAILFWLGLVVFSATACLLLS